MNLFSVTSPFQYICALEAKAHYQTKNNILLLVEQLSEPGLSQQKKLVDDSDWDYIIKIPRTNRTRNLPKAIKEIWRITKNKQINNFFHAEYNGWRTKLLLRNLNINKEIYFDDGTLTINEYEEEIRSKAIYSRKRFVNDLALKLQGIKPIGDLPQSEKLELFTIFDIENPEHVIVKNTLSELKKKVGSTELFDPTSPVGFIGEGAIGHKRRKTHEVYVEEVKNVAVNYPQGIIYFPHRTESQETREAIKAIPSLTYHQSEYPLEIELIEKKIKLSMLIGTLSTAQYTASLIYKDMPIYTIETSIDMLPQNIQRRCKRIEDVYAKRGISTISSKI
ncbi:TPA: glycosyltransferase 52 family protein [Vibrio vulnificus]|uniref:Glycosyltransferase 52 family protein n=1 Tax=Vibrio vulnificus TaxID=672 RepID=A0A2S3R645_VIBVL|nr:glycosyltransferase 52 family protein [Vibrio vulnificus]EHH0749896.1 glycosyltransferase 52 family protein [Vibrio vulnificus]ELP6757200.1 glycosyltransferase 52 family protein [Vibrio vulnificus]MDK2620909.1 glycosyltransferase 52 family protein [Vibrio vulnificus]POB49139.1 glycosyltransferase 52 family protein [Vibrio vulnificus]RAH20235.1 glycosyltransferase 52 family protein [Vibrio vulnificus]